MAVNQKQAARPVAVQASVRRKCRTQPAVSMTSVEGRGDNRFQLQQQVSVGGGFHAERPCERWDAGRWSLRVNAPVREMARHVTGGRRFVGIVLKRLQLVAPWQIRSQGEFRCAKSAGPTRPDVQTAPHPNRSSETGFVAPQR